jgi:hypothetical protein
VILAPAPIGDNGLEDHRPLTLAALGLGLGFLVPAAGALPTVLYAVAVVGIAVTAVPSRAPSRPTE